MAFTVFDTMARAYREFVPIEGRHVRMYTCGPTVYDYAHIGNFRAYVFEDILRRYLKYAGFAVTQAMNLTDVDDKTIRRSREAGVSLPDYTAKFKQAFFEDLKTLNVEPAERYPAATDHIPEMIRLIERLLERGFAYRSDDGCVYFSIAKFGAYGRLAHLDMSGLKPGARVAHDEYEKENLADFALWKAWDEQDGDVAWDSPWGRGRPGWHIECSAMSMKYLGESFDLHTGGVDNIFPHHEDEIAQSEAATGQPFVKYWMHCAHLVVDGRKMSKSLGNFHTLRDVVGRGYTGREIRYLLAAAHYRQSLNFTFDALDGARASLARLDEFQGRLREVGATAGSVQPSASGSPPPAWATAAAEDFRRAMDHDLSISEALKALFDIAREGNRAMDAGVLTPSQADAVLGLLDHLDLVLGFLKRPEEQPDEDALKRLDARQQARTARNWGEADRIRGELLARGWVVQDTPAGPKLKRRQGAL